jgi:hypothetical protein
MPITVKKTVSLSFGTGYTFKKNDDTEAENRADSNPTVTAAEAGTLTTRTDDDTGSLTMGSGSHGITTGALVDVFWTETIGSKTYNRSRANMTVGTVAGTTVPVDGGTGDVLPLAASAVSVKVPHLEDLVVDGDNVSHIAVQSPANGVVTFYAADGTTVVGGPFRLTGDSGSPKNYTYFWDSEYGTNPLTGDAVGKVGFSHASTTASAVMYAATLHN